MRTRLLVLLTISWPLLGATCLPPADTPSQPSTTLAVTLHGPSADRTVPQGTIVAIEWSAVNLTGTPASLTLLVESRDDLARTTLVEGLSVEGLTSIQTFEWDTDAFSRGPYAIIAHLTAGGQTLETTTDGRISVNERPAFAFTAPAEPATLESGGTVTISWTASDPEDEATIRLGIDPDEDHVSGNESFISNTVIDAESPEDSFDWDGTDTSEIAVEPGTYNLFAFVDDGVNVLQTIEGLAHITVAEGGNGNGGNGNGNGDEPNGVTLGIIDPANDVEFLEGADPIEIKFGVNDEQDLLIDLKLDTDDNHANGNEITILSQRLVKADTSTDTFEWDGTDADSDEVADGIYRLFIVASSGTGTPRTVAGSGLIFRRTPIANLSSQQTWQRAGAAWSLVVPDTSAAARRDHAMVYDAAREVTFLFGGLSVDGISRESHAWDGDTWELLGETGPVARMNPAMVYDSDRQLTVLFGGSDLGGRFGDTWEWGGAAWSERSPVDSPAAREGQAMAYDAARQRTILFGGRTASGFNGETWSWDGDNWTQLSPAASPSARADHAMAYDAARERIVLFGGQDTEGADGETWTWDGSNWTQASADDPANPLASHAMAYDSAREVVVRFGGVVSGLAGAETWEWDGTNWTQVSLTTSPAARDGHAMAFDAGAAQMVVFGGASGIPLIGLLEPATVQTVSPGEFLTIRWRDDDPTGRATIRLTVDDDKNPAEATETGSAEVEILPGREAAGDGVEDTFAWQVPATLDPGTYYVFAYIDVQSDTESAAHNAVAPAPFIIEEPGE